MKLNHDQYFFLLDSVKDHVEFCKSEIEYLKEGEEREEYINALRDAEELLIKLRTETTITKESR